MFKKILLALGLIFIPYTSHALDVTILNTVVPVSCSDTKNMDKVFKEEQLIFTGLVDKLNVLKVFLSNDSGYVVMVENAGGLFCIYFNGSLGMKINKSKNTGSELNG